MLDAATKHRIDTARNILVGKIPDPKSQVEQITIALIYKFMDDMDAEAEEFGGKRAFFAGDFVRYGWAKLMRSGLGGHETLNLYAEAIAKMPENPGIPPLFREIFKNAYLPYRDPETLREFLKIIDEFTYDHSEDLGDAFEYLLSVLGAQGDAGQFRTPRHIIDFIVAIVDPRKDESILDPACGTAGFLIAAYKHILKSNTDAQGNSTLTPDDKKRLIANMRGYDISPDMVRLSLVNLYLHGFSDPHIYEYDTLTSQDRWNEYANVILANPPFMSPKGGIKPHNRFSVQSKRSEVLFVDYMAEHLGSTGRAGIIVPEGIIFQSQTAYKQLRKMLVQEYLVAVISLPAGVFQPYSGVKTSVLVLDKALAKQRDAVAFFKVENDGLSLGAQRRPIEKNDLPGVQAEAVEYLQKLRSGEDVKGLSLRHGHVVEKEKIAKGGEYGLSGEKHGKNTISKSIYRLCNFKAVCTLEYGSSLPKDKRIPGSYPVVGSNGITGYHNEYLVTGPTIVVGRKGSAGEVNLIQTNCFPIDTTYYVQLVDSTKIDSYYLYLILKSLNLPRLKDGAGIPGLNRNDVYSECKIPLPPLEVQKEIVQEIEGYQKIIDGARAVVDNYKPQVVIKSWWETDKLVNVAEHILTGPFGSALHKSDYVNGCIPVINPQNIVDGAVIKDDNKTVSDAVRERLKEFTVQQNDILIARRGEMGRCAVVTSEMNGWLCGTGCFIIRVGAKHDAKFIHLQLSSKRIIDILESQAVGVTLKNLNQKILAGLDIFTPPLKIQLQIVSEIEEEQALINANRELIPRFEKKIEAVLARVWGDAQEAGEASDTEQQKPSYDVDSHSVQPRTDEQIPSLIPYEQQSGLRQKALLLVYITNSCHDKYFGHTKAAKNFYLVQKQQGVLPKSVEQFYRHAAGPLDREFFPALDYATEQGWLRQPPERQLPQSGNTIKPIEPGAHMQTALVEARVFLGAKSKAVDVLLRACKEQTVGILELWATALDAALELAAAGKVVTASAVRQIIADTPEWLPKLERPEFSERSITNALASLRKWNFFA